MQAIPPGFVLKSGDTKRLSEACTLNFIAEKTSVPVPKVITAFECKETGCRYILLTTLPGSRLDMVWDGMSEETRSDILTQLQGYMNEIRAIPPPKKRFVSTVGLTSLEDERIFSGRFGPFQNVESFHRATRAGIMGASKWPERGDEL